MSLREGVPSYRRHSSGQARVTLKDPITGMRRDVLLGKYGSRSSRAEYGRVIEAWESSGRRLPDRPATDLTIAEMLLAYWQHVERHYCHADGTATSEQKDIALALRPLRELYANVPAAEFGPLKLQAVRKRIIDNGCCRSVVNQRINRIRRAFKWATSQELIPANVLHGLEAVEGIRRGRGVRESEPVKPVPVDIVERTIPHLPRVVAAIVRLMLLTAARTGELVIMRTCDLDTSGRVWVYRPQTHKAAHHGKTREIYLGPQAQEVLKPWLKFDLQAYIFTPAEAENTRNLQRGEQRQTPRYPSHMRRNELKRVGSKRRRSFAQHYDTHAVHIAIRRACDKAFPPPVHLCKLPGESQSLRAIARELNERGHSTRRGRSWNAMQVARVLARYRIQKAS